MGLRQASSTASVLTTLGAPDTPSTQARLQLTGLVPSGVYSVFYGTLGPDSEHPGCPGVERTLPLPRVNDGRRAPDPASFVADSGGSGVYVGRVEGDLLAAGQVFFSIVNHFDGMTYYPFQTEASTSPTTAKRPAATPTGWTPCATSSSCRSSEPAHRNEIGASSRPRPPAPGSGRRAQGPR